MHSRTSFAVCSVSALLCLPAAALAQSANPSAPPAQQSQAAPGQTQPAAPGLQLQSLPPDAHTLTPAEQAQERQQQALAVALRLASIQAQWGAGMSTPGLSMSLVEANRTKADNGATQISYHLTASGFTPGDSLSLLEWRLNEQAHKVMSGLTLNPDGLAICAPPPTSPAAPSAPGSAPSAASAPNCTTTMKPNDPVVITATVATGEPVRAALIDDDRSRGAAATIVPFPLANEDKGCKLQILLGIQDASMVLVEGTGFPPNTPLRLESVTGSKSRTLTPTTNADGKLVVVDLPEANGQASGTTTVRFAGVNHQPTLDETKAAKPDPVCAPAVTFPWGKGTYKPQ